MNDELIKKWKKTGLLDKVEESLLLVISNNLENCAKYVIQKYDSSNGLKKESEFVAGWIFPLVVCLGRNRNILSINMPRL